MQFRESQASFFVQNKLEKMKHFRKKMKHEYVTLVEYDTSQTDQTINFELIKVIELLVTVRVGGGGGWARGIYFLLVFL